MDYNNYDSGPGFIFYLLYFAVIVFMFLCVWRIFVKAGKPGWAAIVPIYNVLVELQIIGRPWWWLILTFIPIVNIVIIVMIMFNLAKVFGKGTGFGFGLIFLSPIFMALLAFGDAKYLGPIAGQPTVYTPPYTPPPAPPAV